jgi:hypothetical protein
MRKSSIHFKSVESISFAISHAERTELTEPGYLLPQKHRLGNSVVDGSLSEAALKNVFEKRKAGLSRQARTAGASPFWEGVMVLPEYHGQDYGERQAKKLKEWKAAFEESTGMQVLHMSIHLDEGYISDAGEPQYNPHAHIFVDRTDDKNKILKFGRGQMSAMQDLTAEKMEIQRGETLDDRGGKRGRRHIDSKDFRELSHEVRLELKEEKESSRESTASIINMWRQSAQRAKKAEADLAQAKADLDQAAARETRLTESVERESAERAAQLARAAHDANYRELRGWMIGDGRAKQGDYSALKKMAEGPNGPDKIQRLIEIWESGGDALEAMRPIRPPAPKPAQQPAPEAAQQLKTPKQLSLLGALSAKPTARSFTSAAPADSDPSP